MTDQTLADEVKRLTGCLQRANDNMERAERELYLKLEEMEIRAENAECECEKARAEVERLVRVEDCHPATEADACGACLTCVNKVLAAKDREVERWKRSTGRDDPEALDIELGRAGIDTHLRVLGRMHITASRGREEALKALRELARVNPVQLGNGGACMMCGFFPDKPDEYTRSYYASVGGKLLSAEPCRLCQSMRVAAALVVGDVRVFDIAGHLYYGIPL